VAIVLVVAAVLNQRRPAFGRLVTIKP